MIGLTTEGGGAYTIKEQALARRRRATIAIRVCVADLQQRYVVEVGLT